MTYKKILVRVETLMYGTHSLCLVAVSQVALKTWLIDCYADFLKVFPEKNRPLSCKNPHVTYFMLSRSTVYLSSFRKATRCRANYNNKNVAFLLVVKFTTLKQQILPADLTHKRHLTHLYQQAACHAWTINQGTSTFGRQDCSCSRSLAVKYAVFYKQLEMWANAQRDGRPAKYRWRPLFNTAKFGWHPLLDAVQ